MYQEQLINSNESMTIIPATNRYENVYSRIILLKLNGTIEHMVFSMVKDLESETTEFSGKIYMTTLDGDYINAYKIVDGVAVSRYKKPEDKLSKNLYARSSGEECWGIACGMEGDEVYLEGKGRGSDNHIPILWLFLPTESSPFGGGGMELDAGIGWDYGGGGGGFVPLCGTGYVSDAYGNCVIEIRNNLTNPCAKSIFSDLQIEMLKKEWKEKLANPAPNVSRTFSESILKLFNESKSVHLTITNGYLKDANGSTSGTSITISDSYLKNATQLSIARTMIHEMTHAYLNVKYSNAMSFDNGMDFRMKMEKYAKDNGIADINSNKFHHEFMGQYVDAMAASLLIWDEKYGTGGIKIKDSTGNDVLDWEYYRNMAFGGLNYKDSTGNRIDTDSFKALVPNKADRDKIKNLLINEQNGNSNAKGSKCK